MTTKILSENDYTDSRRNFSRLLLGATSTSTIVAAGIALSFSVPKTAHAVDITSTNAGAATAQIDNTTLTFATDGAFGLIDTNITNNVTTTSVTEDGTLYLDDEGNIGGNAATIDFEQTVTIASGKTLTIQMATEVDGTAGNNVDLDFSGAVAGAAGSILITGFDGAATDVGDIEFGSTVILNALTIESGDGGAAAGTATTLTDIVGAAAVGTLIIRGGAGSTAAAVAGGDFILTNLTGDISGTTATISGGDGGVSAFTGTGGAGATMTVTAIGSDIASTTLNFDAGDGADGTSANSGRTGGAGGNSTFDAVTGAISSTTFNIRGGAGGSGIASGAANSDGGIGGTIAVFDIDGAVTADVNLLGGAGGTGGAGTTAVGGAGAAGGALGSGDGSFAALVTGNIVLQGGAAGAGADAGTAAGGAGAAGGAVVVDNFAAGIVGNLSVLGGAGSSGGDGNANAAGGAGADGGLATITDVSSATVGINGADTSVGSTITVTGGNAGNAGARGTGGVGGAGGAGGAATITTADGPVDAATIAITGGDGGDGGAASVGNAGEAAGAAGTATATLEGTDAFQITTVNVIGGNAGNGGAGGTTAAGGAGTAGGAATLTSLSAAVTAQGGSGAVTINITGGTGGNGGNAGTGVAGVAGVNGGNATFTTTAAAIAANVTLDDGTDGSAGTAGSGGDAGGGAGSGGVATLNITGTTTLTGDITAAADNEGVVTVAGGTFTVIGGIGVSGTEVDQITLSGGSGDLTITGSVFAKDIGLDGDDNLTLNGAGTLQVVSGAIDADANTGDITTGTNAVVRFDGAIGQDSAGIADAVNTITLGTGSTTTFNKTVNATSITTNATGTTTIEDLITLSGDFDAATGTTVTLGRGIVAGETAISYANGGAFAAGGITVNMPETFNTGTITLTTESGNSGSAAADIANITFGTNFLTTFSAAADAGDDDVLVTANRKSASTIASALNIQSQEATALDNSVTALATGDATALSAMEDALVAGGLTAKTAAETVGVQADSLGATSAVASAVGGTVMSINTTRLAMLREGTAYSANGTGFAAGSGMMARNVWLRPFGTTVDQDATGGIAGFDAETYGAVAGIDLPLGMNGRIGISGNYAVTDIDGEGAGNAQTETDGYGVNLYGDFSSSNAYFEFLAGYGWNENDTNRTITIGGLQRTASASFDSTQYTIGIGGGAPRSLGGGSFLTPTFSLSHTSTETDNYTETGAGNLNMTVSSADVSATIGAIGVRYHSVVNAGNGRTITPELSVAMQYDFASDEAVATASFAGGGAAFTTTGAEVEELGATVGAGVAFAGPGMSVGVSYDALMKSDYVSHTGAAELKVSF